VLVETLGVLRTAPRVWVGEDVAVTVETLGVSETPRVWEGAGVAVSVAGGIWLGVRVWLAISLAVGVSDANDTVSSASAVCTPLGVAVAGIGEAVGGAAQAAARPSRAIQQTAQRGTGTREL